MSEAFDLDSTVVHLGRGSTAVPFEGADWSEAWLERYQAKFEADGEDGRMVCVFPQPRTWTTWERHPAGEELVVLLSGRIDVIQDVDGMHRTVALGPGEAMINPRGVWHTADVHEPGEGLFITPGLGTEHRPR
jgi:mannose-6-phosphate isomerase-like protein (cupin superfamily)